MSSISIQYKKEYPLQKFGVDAVFSPNNQLVAVVSNSGTIDLLNVEGEMMAQLKAYETPNDPYTFSHAFLDAKFSSSSQQILTGLTDGTARLWDLSGEELLCLKGHQGDVVRVWFSEDDNKLFSFSLDNTFRIWDLNGHQLKMIGEPTERFSRDSDKQTYLQIEDELSKAIVSPEGQFVFLKLDEESQIPSSLWSSDGEKKATFRLNYENITEPIIFHPNSQVIVTGCTDGTARIWDVNGRQLGILPNVNANHFSFSPDGKILAVASALGSLSLWNFQDTVKLVEKNEVHEFLTISSLSFNQEGQFILTTGLNDGTIKIWDLNLNQVALLHHGDEFIQDLSKRVSGSGEIISAKFSSDDQHILAVSRRASSTPGYLMLWQVSLQTALTQPESPIYSKSTKFDSILADARQLSLNERLRLIREVTESVEQDFKQSNLAEI